MKTTTVKIGTRITLEENRRLEQLAIIGGFKSTYSLLRYLVFCFLRASNHTDNDNTSDEIPPEIVSLFAGSYGKDSKLISRAIRNILKRKDWKQQKRRQRHPKKSDIRQEVADLFDDCEEKGSELEWRPDINGRR
jgi:hypothetical protein